MSILHLFVVGILNEEISRVRLLRRVRSQQAGTVGVAPPDLRAKGGEQVLELGMQAVWIGSKVEQCVALLGQLFRQARDVARQLAILGVVELGDAAVGGAAARRQAKAQAFGYLADGWVVGAKYGDPARAVPARHARVVHVGGRVAGAGAHGMGVEIAWGEEEGGQQCVDGQRAKVVCWGVTVWLAVEGYLGRGKGARPKVCRTLA